MAGDTTVQTHLGKELRRDVGDGTTATMTVLADEDGVAVTATNPLPVEVIDDLLPSRLVALSGVHGESMELANGSYGGTELEIYTADATLWGIADSGSSLTAISAEQKHTGTNSAKWDGPNTGDILTITSPTPPQALGGYVAFTFWLFIGAGYSAGNTITVSGWDGVAVVGTPATIEAQIDTTQQGSWQLVAFDLEDLGLDGQSINAVRLEFFKVSAPTLVYLDDFGFQETSGAEPFEVRAAPGTHFVARKLVTVLVDDIDASLADASMPALDPLALLGLGALPNGIFFELVIDGVATPFVGTFKNICDFLVNDAELTTTLSRNSNTCVKAVLILSHPVLLRGGEEDYFRFTMRDDMRGLVRMVTFVGGGVRPAP